MHVAAETNTYFSGVWVVIVALGIAENFGHGAGYGIPLFSFAPIMFLVLGFGGDQYKPVRA